MAEQVSAIAYSALPLSLYATPLPPSTSPSAFYPPTPIFILDVKVFILCKLSQKNKTKKKK